MVAQLLRLKLQVLANSLRGTRWEVTGRLVAVLYGVAVTLAAFAGIVRLRSMEVDLARDLIIVIGSMITLGFVLLPLVFGANDALDPRSFRTLGFRNAQLADALVVPGLISIPVAALAIVAVANAVAFSRGFWSGFVAVISVSMIVLAGTLTLRIMSAVAQTVVASRQAREISGVVGTFVLVAMLPALILFASSHWGYSGLKTLAGFANALSWSPLGSAWAIASDAASGYGWQALLKLLLTLCFLGLLWMVWRWVVARLQTHMSKQHEVAEVTSRIGWFERLSRGPTGAVAARSLVYWARDARYRTSLVIIPIIPIVTVVPLAIAGVPVEWLMFIPVPSMCLFLGWALHNDVAFDNSAIWLHIASGVSGRADRLGRLMPTLLVGLPLIAVGTVITYALVGDGRAVPALIGMSVCLLLSGIGMSSYVSVRFPYPAVRPGDSPFAQPQSIGTSAGITQSVLFAAIVVAASPTAVFTALGFTRNPGWHWAALVVGVVVGVGILVAGVIMGGRVFERRNPDLLAAALQN